MSEMINQTNQPFDQVETEPVADRSNARRPLYLAL